MAFADFKEAFDNLGRSSLGKISRHNGIQQKLVIITQFFYGNCEWQVIHNDQLTEPFRMDSGIKQGCLQLPILFPGNRPAPLMCHLGKRQRIQSTLTSVLEDVKYSDDLGLPSHRHQDMQQKTETRQDCKYQRTQGQRQEDTSHAQECLLQQSNKSQQKAAKGCEKVCLPWQ